MTAPDTTRDWDALYAAHAPTIRRTARRFAQRFRADYDAVLSEANMAFLRAVRTHDPARGDLGKRVVFRVWQDCCRYCQRQVKRKSLLPRAATYDVEWAAALEADDNRRQLWSWDAWTVVKLLATATDDLAALLRSAARNRDAVLDRLRRIADEMAWDEGRADRAFAEIAGYL